MSKLNLPARVVLLVVCVWALTGCGGRQEHTISGYTMGTTYHIKVIAERSVDMAAIQVKVDERLEQINQSMSTFRPDSEISRFNAMTETDVPFQVSADFLRVMLGAHELYHLTGGALDGTVQPLLNLWGFGQKGPLLQIPAEETVRAVLEQVGLDLIEVSVSGWLSKKRADVSVDLGSIAKGYGVDQVSILLFGMGFKDFLVEIGGDLLAIGKRLDGQPWRVGINQPDRLAPVGALYGVVQLSGLALATSGDYRNFIEIEGRFYSHIIDPGTGYPVQNAVVSTSVIADNCMLADALATALFVMGPEKGVALLDELPGVEGLIITRQPDGELHNFTSQGFGAMLQ
jgi:FAD:protein FMN transferase